MKYAVVKIGGSQFKVKEGMKLEVAKLIGKEGNILDLKEVFLLAGNSDLKVGKPIVEKAIVKAKILKHFQGKKLHISKFKAKTGYQRKIGFRPQKTQLEIEKIIG